MNTLKCIITILIVNAVNYLYVLIQHHNKHTHIALHSQVRELEKTLESMIVCVVKANSSQCCKAQWFILLWSELQLQWCLALRDCMVTSFVRSSLHWHLGVQECPNLQSCFNTLWGIHNYLKTSSSMLHMWLVSLTSWQL